MVETEPPHFLSGQCLTRPFSTSYPNIKSFYCVTSVQIYTEDTQKERRRPDFDHNWLRQKADADGSLFSLLTNELNRGDDFMHWERRQPDTRFRMLERKRNEQIQTCELLLFIATAAQCPHGNSCNRD